MNYEAKGFFTVQLRLTQNTRDYPLHFPYNIITVPSLTSTSKLCAHFHRCRRRRSKICFSFRYVKQALWWLIGRLQINIEQRAFPLTDATFNWACEFLVEHEELLVFIVSLPQKAFMFTSARTAVQPGNACICTFPPLFKKPVDSQKRQKAQINYNPFISSHNQSTSTKYSKRKSWNFSLKTMSTLCQNKTGIRY